MCKSQAKSLFSKPRLPTQLLSSGILASQVPPVSWEFNSFLYEIVLWPQKASCVLCPLKWPLSLFPFPSPPNLWPKMLTQIYHQSLHGCQALFNLLYESSTKKKKKLHPKCRWTSPKLPCTRMCTIPCKWEKWSLGCLVGHKMKKVAITSSKHPVSLQKLNIV